MKKELICISCPNGCNLEVEYGDGQVWSVANAECPKGKDYADSEILHPSRIVTTTVALEGASIQFLPVRTAVPVPRELCRDIVLEASRLTVDAPVKCGQTIAKNILGSGADLVATRSAGRRV